MKVSGIYAIEHVTSSRLYIGSSRDIAYRWKEHRRLLRCGKHHSQKLQRAWSKYGESAFRFILIEECDLASLLEREQYHIDSLCPFFNICRKAGSRLGSKATAESRLRMKAVQQARAALITHCPKGHAYNEKNTLVHQGKRVCRECARLAMANRIANETPEQRNARQQKTMAHYHATKGGRGIAEWGSEQHRLRISAAHTGKKRSAETRKRFSEATKRWLTPEHLQKMWAAARKHQAIHGNPNLGKPMSQEQRTKIRATLLAKVTHCKHGHEFTPENTLVENCRGRPKRICRTCRRRIKLAARANETPEQKERRLFLKRESERRRRERKRDTIPA